MIMRKDATISNDQMDEIRAVVGKLGAKQTIIVSHEPKIESYVDNIIRLSVSKSGITHPD